MPSIAWSRDSLFSSIHENAPFRELTSARSGTSRSIIETMNRPQSAIELYALMHTILS